MLQSYVTVIDEATVNAQYCRGCGKTFEKQRIVKWLLMRSKWRILFGTHIRKAWDWAQNGPLTTVSLLVAWDSENSQSSINFGCGKISLFFGNFTANVFEHDWARSITWMDWNLFFRWSICEVSRVSSSWWNFELMDVEFGRKEGCKLQPQNTLSLIHT